MTHGDYGGAVRIVRTRAKLSMGELARRTGYDVSFISLLEAGKRKPSLEALETLATACGSSILYVTCIANGVTMAEALEELHEYLAALVVRKKPRKSETPTRPVPECRHPDTLDEPIHVGETFMMCTRCKKVWR